MQAVESAAALAGRPDLFFKASIVSALTLQSCLHSPTTAHVAVDLLEESLEHHPSFASFLLRPLKMDPLADRSASEGTVGKVWAVCCCQCPV
jgi:hypothetical protein